MTPRLRRATRLLDLAEDAVSSARSRVAVASRTVAACRGESEREERHWLVAAEEFARGVLCASDLEQQSAHLRTLRWQADEGARRLERALDEERRCSAALVEAATERRKLELWRDRILLTEREEQAGLDRRSEDELAARATRVRP